MARFQNFSEEALVSQDLVLIQGIPFHRKAAKAFQNSQSPDEQLCVLNALTVIQMQATMRPVDDNYETITFNEARMGKALVRYAQHKDTLCVINFKILETFPRTKGLQILSTQQVRIRDGTLGGLLSWYVQRRTRAKYQRKFAALTNTQNQNPKGQRIWLEFTSSSNQACSMHVQNSTLRSNRGACTTTSLRDTSEISWTTVSLLNLLIVTEKENQTALLGKSSISTKSQRVFEES